MPQRNSVTGKLLRAARRRRSRWDEWNEQDEQRAAPEPAPPKRSRRLAATTFFVVSFVLGAALSAGAGDTFTTLVEDTATTPVEDTATTPATDTVAAADTIATEAPSDAAPAQTPVPETVSEEAATPASPPAAQPLAEPEVVADLAPPAGTPAPTPAPAAPPTDASAPPEPASTSSPTNASASPEPASTSSARKAPKARPKPARQSKRKAKARTTWRPGAEPILRTRAHPRQLGSELEPETRIPGVDATVWLHRSLPDPTPPSKRLSRGFAQSLRGIARDSQVDWALMLGLLRAEGRTGAAPATAAQLDALASRLAARRGQDVRSTALALAGDSERADRAVALAHYHRAVGLRALERGLEWAKPRLEARLLRDDRVATYEGGRFDIASGRVDVRVLALIAYLADTYGEVTVSCLKTGHRLYSRPGVISAHVYGLAVDISALGGVSIAGHQEPGGLTEDAVRNILLLPSELMPRQVISLLGLGGPSFPLGDHGDHIHVGY